MIDSPHMLENLTHKFAPVNTLPLHPLPLSPSLRSCPSTLEHLRAPAAPHSLPLYMYKHPFYLHPAPKQTDPVFVTVWISVIATSAPVVWGSRVACVIS